MCKSIPMAFVLLIAAVVSATSQVEVRAADATSYVVTKWEYRVLTKEQILDLGKKDLAAGLNQLGDEGWELAAVESAYIFKRPRQQRTVEDARRQLAAAEADAEMQKDRAAWSERMFK